MDRLSPVGVLDKAVALLDAAAHGPANLAGMVDRTGLPRATVHRIAAALVAHDLLELDEGHRYRLGHMITRLSAGMADPLVLRAPAVLRRLQEQTGESAQLYQRRGALRVCVASAEAPHGLRDTVPVGAELPMSAGSAAQVLLAFRHEAPPPGAAFDAAALARVRRAGWAATAAEREPGVASVSAPVLGRDGVVIAAVSVSGPLSRLDRSGARRVAPLLVAAARQIGTDAGNEQGAR